MAERVRVGVRKGSNNQWFGVVENLNGDVLYFSESFSTEEEALEAAKKASI